MKPEVIDPPENEETTDSDENDSDASESATKHTVSLSTSVCEVLECPVCMNTMYPPISQCSNGHTLCSGCKTRVKNQCPTCRHELGDIRCLVLEKIAASLELPCRYQSSGCTGICPYYSKLEHESQCTYRPYNCPYSGSECSATGDIPFLVSHLRDDHKVNMHSGEDFNILYVRTNPSALKGEKRMLTVFSCYGQHLCLHFEAFSLGTSPVYMAFVQFLGEEEEAKKYRYNLEVEGNGRKMNWQGVARSLRDSLETVRDSLDGLILHRKMALFLSGGDEKRLKLSLTGKIWKEKKQQQQ